MKKEWQHPTLCELEKLNKNEIATKFCYGNENLRLLLLQLWEKGVETYTCSAGNDQYNGFPAISIYLKNKQPSIDFLQKLILNVRAEFKSQAHIGLAKIPCLVFTFIGKNPDKFFENLLLTTQEYSPIEENLPPKEYIDKVYQIMLTGCGWEAVYHLLYNGENVYVYENGKRKFVLTYEQTFEKFSEIADWLKEHLRGKGDRCIITPALPHK